MHAPAPPRVPLDDGFVAALRQRFGDALALGEGIRRQHGTSEAHFAEALPDAVVFAASTGEVVDCVRLCVAAGVAIVPFGAGTSIEGNALPIHGGVSIGLSRMDAIIAVNAEDFDCTVQAGVRREALNTHLRDTGLFFPIDPGANATIGGMASTRASGTNAVRYGTMREAVLSLTVVTADGTVIRTGTRARKSAAGYDLTRLFVGAEGTLGIVTEVTLRLHPIPETISSAICGFATLHGAVDTVVQSIQSGVPLARVEILDDKQMTAVNRWSKLDYTGSRRCSSSSTAPPRASPSRSRPSPRWRRRTAAAPSPGRTSPRSAPGCGRRGTRPITRSTSAPGRSAGPPTSAFRSAACPNASSPRARTSTRAPSPPRSWGMSATAISTSSSRSTRTRRTNSRKSRRSTAASSSVRSRWTAPAPGEHGIGIGKQDWLVAELGDAVDTMRTIKRALDPLNLMNPGKIFSL